MHPGLLLTASAMSVALVVTALLVAFGRARGWHDQRRSALFGVAAFAYSVCESQQYSAHLSPWLHAAMAGWSLSSATVALALLMWQTARARGPKTGRLDRLAIGASLGVAALFVVPTVGFAPRVVVRLNGFAGYPNYDVDPTPVGVVGYVATIAVLLVALGQALRGSKASTTARAHTVALGFVLAGGLNDMLVTAGLFAAPFLTSIGFVCALATIAVDLTRRFIGSAAALDALSRELERRVEERTSELASAHAKLERAEKLAAVGQLAAGVAHEVNNPLAVVLANLEILRETTGLDADAVESVDHGLAAAQRIARIVQQLHNAGQAAVRSDAVDARVDVVAAVRCAVDTVRVSQGPSVTIEVEAPEPTFAMGERTMLEQVLTNLLVNAVHAVVEAGGRGPVRVRLSRDLGKVRLAVEDEGVGMTDATKKRLFEPFFTTKPVGKGTGLGLAVSAGLVATMRGSIDLRSEPGQGTKIVVTLDEAPPPVAPPQAEAMPAPLPRRRVLLVDDDLTVARVLERALSRVYDVRVASSVGAALEAVASAPFDAVLCDVMMPDGGAEAFQAALFALGSSLERRMLFVTGGARTPSARRFVERERDRVLFKPFPPAELVAAVERAFAGA